MFDLTPQEVQAVKNSSTCEVFREQKLSAMTVANVVTAINAMMVKPGENLGPIKYLINLRELLTTDASGRSKIVNQVEKPTICMWVATNNDTTITPATLAGGGELGIQLLAAIQTSGGALVGSILAADGTTVISQSLNNAALTTLTLWSQRWPKTIGWKWAAAAGATQYLLYVLWDLYPV